MTRRLFNLVTVLSLLGCVAVVVLWVRSLFVRDAVAVVWRGQPWEVVSHGGRLRLHNELARELAVQRRDAYMASNGRIVQAAATEWFRKKDREEDEVARRAAETYGASIATEPRHRRAMAQSERDELMVHVLALPLPPHPPRPPPPIRRSVHFSVVILAPAVLAAPALAGWMLHAVWRRRRSGAGRCAACGYDLRATPGRCPECGSRPQMWPESTERHPR